MWFLMIIVTIADCRKLSSLSIWKSSRFLRRSFRFALNSGYSDTTGDREALLQREPDSSAWPADALNTPYVGSWNYWYRTNGMRTSSDDVLAAFIATQNEALVNSSISVNRYVDLGCGVGSILLLVAHTLRPKLSIGIEAQKQSIMLASRTLCELPKDAPDIRVYHRDIRSFLNPTTNQLCAEDASLIGNCDLITANPPYSRLGTGTVPKDPQRMSARFELRGGVEEYMLVAARLLSSTGRFTMVFWSKDDSVARVHRAAEAAGLRVLRVTDFLMGKSYSAPHDINSEASKSSTTQAAQLVVFELSLACAQSISTPHGVGHACQQGTSGTVRTIDITVPIHGGGYSDTYRAILKRLCVAPRQPT